MIFSYLSIELSTTRVTMKRFEPAVFPHMCNKVGGLTETFVACTTLVRSFAWNMNKLKITPKFLHDLFFDFSFPLFDWILRVSFHIFFFIVEFFRFFFLEFLDFISFFSIFSILLWIFDLFFSKS